MKTTFKDLIAGNAQRMLFLLKREGKKLNTIQSDEKTETIYVFRSRRIVVTENTAGVTVENRSLIK